jgi:diguanylate cyclase (GGDEF)-like protein
MLSTKTLRQILDICELVKLRSSLDEVAARIAKTAHKELGFESVLFSVLDAEGKHFERTFAVGIPAATFKRLAAHKVPVSVYERFFKDRFKAGTRSYFVPHHQVAGHIDDNIAYVPKVSKKHGTGLWRSHDLLLVPFWSGDKIVGTLSLDRPKDGHRPSPETIMLLEILAAQAVQAIENTLVFNQTTERVKQLATLCEVGGAIASTLKLEEVLKLVVDILHEKFHYLWVIIALLDDEQKRLRIAAQAGWDDKLMKSLKIPVGVENGLMATVVAKGKSIVVGDLKGYDGSYIKAGRQARSAVAVAIKQRDQVIGVIDIESGEPNRFTEDDVKTLEQLSGQIAVAIENARLFEEESRELSRRTALIEIGQAINSILDLDTLLQKVLDILRNVFKFSNACVMLANPEGTELIDVAHIGFEGDDERPGTVPIGKGLTGTVLWTGEPLVVDDVRKSPLYLPGLKNAKSELVMPLKRGEKVIGVLNFESTQPNAFSQSDLQPLKIFANQISIAVANAKMYEQMEKLAITDGLTGLFNHRYFIEQLEHEVRRSKRLKHPVSVLMIDIDHFKHYNDTLGHPKGDMVLRLLADLMRKTVREEIDTPARYGGEEFSIILPEAEKSTAAEVAERLRTDVFKSMFPEETVQPIGTLTISVGVAAFPEDAANGAELISKADVALYEAKNSGRNRVCLA